MTTTTEAPVIDFTAPMPARKGGGGAGTGRVAVEWEKRLGPARSNPGKGGKLTEFADKTVTTATGETKTVTGQAQATSKASAISARLRTAVPLEEWKFNTRPLNEDGSVVGLWVTFIRTMNAEQLAEFDKLRKERSDKIKATRAANADGKAAEAETATATQSAAEKVKAAREAKNR